MAPRMRSKRHALAPDGGQACGHATSVGEKNRDNRDHWARGRKEDYEKLGVSMPMSFVL